MEQVQERASSDARRPRVLLCASGSVAVVKLPALALALAEFADVRVVLTRAAGFFMQQAAAYDAHTSAAFDARSADFGAEAAAATSGDEGRVIEIIRDEHEWADWRVVGDRVLHIDVRISNKHSCGSERERREADGCACVTYNS